MFELEMTPDGWKALREYMEAAGIISPVSDGEELRPGVVYRCGPGAELYSKQYNALESETIFLRHGEETVWTADDLEAIAADMRARQRGNR